MWGSSIKWITSPFKDLIDCYNDGAVIETSRGEEILFRTVVQLDGDVLTLSPKSSIPDQDLRTLHWQNVDKRIKKLGQALKRAEKTILMVLSSVILTIILICTHSDINYNMTIFHPKR